MCLIFIELLVYLLLQNFRNRFSTTSFFLFATPPNLVLLSAWSFFGYFIIPERVSYPKGKYTFGTWCVNFFIVLILHCWIWWIEMLKFTIPNQQRTPGAPDRSAAVLCWPPGNLLMCNRKVFFFFVCGAFSEEKPVEYHSWRPGLESRPENLCNHSVRWTVLYPRATSFSAFVKKKKIPSGKWSKSCDKEI